jgi:hypothetical protein
LYEGALQLVALIERRLRQTTEELDRDRLLPDQVLRAIDDRKPAFANEGFDLILFGDQLPCNSKRIPCGHRGVVSLSCIDALRLALLLLHLSSK